MINGYLYRYKSSEGYTAGMLAINGELFYTIERPWLGNQSNVSCIPAGIYSVGFLAKSGSGRYRNVWHIQNVPGRYGVLVHKGNLASHSKGCIILGSKPGKLGGKQAVLSSATAMRRLVQTVGKNPFTLYIIGNQHV